MKVTQIKESCLYTSRLDEAEYFYKTIMGFEMITKDAGRHIFFRAGSSVLLIFNPEVSSRKSHLPPHDGFGRVHLAFEVAREDYDKYKEQLSQKGVTILHEEVWSAHTRSFYFHDPAGHLLEILEPGLWDQVKKPC